MQQQAVEKGQQLPVQEGKRGRGRPRTGTAKSTAVRSKQYRARKRQNPKSSWAYAQVTKVTPDQLRQFMTLSRSKVEAQALLFIHCACGAFIAWDRLTWAIDTDQRTRDREELAALIGWVHLDNVIGSIDGAAATLGD